MLSQNFLIIQKSLLDFFVPRIENTMILLAVRYLEKTTLR